MDNSVWLKPNSTISNCRYNWMMWNGWVALVRLWTIDIKVKYAYQTAVEQNFNICFTILKSILYKVKKKKLMFSFSCTAKSGQMLQRALTGGITQFVILFCNKNKIPACFFIFWIFFGLTNSILWLQKSTYCLHKGWLCISHQHKHISIQAMFINPVI